jgi:two-component system, LytTR family, response regulator
MIKALIVDDEPSAVNTLQLMLERYIPEISNLRSTNDAQEAVLLIRDFQPDLVFLDIQMPVLNGFELLKKIGNIRFDIIFTTAHDQYAIQAIRFSALDYLLKPIDADELRAAFEKFMRRRMATVGNQSLYQNLLYNINAGDKNEFKLAVPTSEGTFFYFPHEILRLEGESNYTRFFFTGKKPLLVSKTLKEYEEILSEHGFIRVHKSHLINKAHVQTYTPDGHLILADQSRIEISRRRKEEVMEALKRK